jgi:Mg2+-importing ATPase
MIVFGPLSLMSDILTFRLGFHARATLLAAAGSPNRPSSSTSPSCLSRASAGPSPKANPGPALLLSSAAIAAITTTLPYSPLAGPLGLTAMVINPGRLGHVGPVGDARAVPREADQAGRPAD